MSPKQMTTHVRLKRLRDLVVQVERMPPSPERDRVLQEIRARAVDVDTGVSPRAMLPVEPAPPISEPRQFVRRMSALEQKHVPLEGAKADSVASSNGVYSQAAAPGRSRPILPSPQESWLLRDDELLPLADGRHGAGVAAGHETDAAAPDRSARPVHWGHASTGTRTPARYADTDGGAGMGDKDARGESKDACPPHLPSRIDSSGGEPTRVTTPSGRSATAETGPAGASSGRVADVDMEIPPPGPKKKAVGPSVRRARHGQDAPNLGLGRFAASGVRSAPWSSSKG
jgi:hypothetical protein